MVIAAAHPFLSSLQHVIGFLVVLVALIILWGVTVLIGSIFSQATFAPPVAVSEPEDGGIELDEEEAAAIAATVACLMGRRSRIVSIRSAATKDWNREGRREHFASHKIR